MSNKIQLKRGMKVKLPRLSYGEPAFVSDEKELYIGTESGENIKLTHRSEIESINIQLIKSVRNNKDKEFYSLYLFLYVS